MTHLNPPYNSDWALNQIKAHRLLVKSLRIECLYRCLLILGQDEETVFIDLAHALGMSSTDLRRHLTCAQEAVDVLAPYEEPDYVDASAILPEAAYQLLEQAARRAR